MSEERQHLQSSVPPWARNPRVIAGAVVSLLFFVFVLQNGRSVEVSFLFWDFRMRLIVLMVLCALAGVGIWELVRYVRRRRQAT